MAKRIAVVGAGTMGQGIARVAAQVGHPVALHDADQEALAKALRTIDASLERGIERGELELAQRNAARRRIEARAELEGALSGADFVIEAVVENLEVKRELLARIEDHVAADTVLSSNTSSLPIARLAEGLRRPDRLIGMHFFNPVHIMRLVEIVVHPKSAAEARTRTVELARALGKEPIVVRDSPGFATSRLGVVLGLEAMRMVEAEVASAQDIDKAMELGYRHPMGPLRLSDLVGLDVRLAIAETLHRELGGEQYRPPAILRDKVARGELGRKSGRGFYAWPEEAGR